MCGRYYFVFDEKKEGFLKQVVSQLSLYNFEQGEIFPNQMALTLIKEQETIKAKTLKWGIDSFQNKVLINARNETKKEKKTFAKMDRCVIPCNGFFEWKKVGSTKKKIFIQKKEQDLVYLAGLCNQDHFVILTSEAELEMKKVHHRTPLILDEKQMKAYLEEAYEPCTDNENLLFTLKE